MIAVIGIICGISLTIFFAYRAGVLNCEIRYLECSKNWLYDPDNVINEATSAEKLIRIRGRLDTLKYMRIHFMGDSEP